MPQLDEPPLHIALAPHGAESDLPPAQVVAVAGVVLRVDRPLAELGPFVVRDGGWPLAWPGAAADAAPGDQAQVCFQGRGLIAGRERAVRCVSGVAGSVIEVEDVGRFPVAADGGWIGFRRPDWMAEDAPRADRTAGRVDALLAEAVLGPPLMLALARRGRWCLHASALAVSLDEEMGVAAFLGSSGVGKSTLAAALDGHDGWLRVADDVLPIEVAHGHRPRAWPRFPQLKLASDRQHTPPPAVAPPLAGLVILHPRPAGTTLALTLLRRPEAARAILRHTVGSRLLDHEGMADHLRMAADLAGCVPIWRLDLPRGPRALADASVTLRRTLSEAHEAGRVPPGDL